MISITNNVVSSNLAHREVSSIQHYMIKFVSDLRRIGGFLWVLRFPPQIKQTAMNKLKYCLLLNMALIAMTLALYCKQALATK